jgi:outer membrane biosynthesis protein TonB
MPGIDETENEWRYRVRDPDLFEKFRRKEITDGVAIIYGKLKGKDEWEIQAYRFSKERFKTKEQVRKWLKKHEIASASRDDDSIRWQARIDVRAEQIQSSDAIPGLREVRIPISGVAVDDSTNANNWRIPVEELENVAKQLENTVITVDHGHGVRDTVGRLEKAWVDGNRVLFEGLIVTANPDIIVPIKNGLINSVSFEAKADAEVKGSDQVKELHNFENARISLVLDPAYENTKFIPHGFVAGVEKWLNDHAQWVPDDADGRHLIEGGGDSMTEKKVLIKAEEEEKKKAEEEEEEEEEKETKEEEEKEDKEDEEARKKLAEAEERLKMAEEKLKKMEERLKKAEEEIRKAEEEKKKAEEEKKKAEEEEKKKSASVVPAVEDVKASTTDISALQKAAVGELYAAIIEGHLPGLNPPSVPNFLAEDVSRARRYFAQIRGSTPVSAMRR